MKKIEWKYGEAYTDGKIVVFDASTKANPDKWAKVDLDVWEDIKGVRWRATRRRKKYYVRNGRILLHRHIMSAPENLVVDHIDDNGLNNTKSNMQLCTASENIIWGSDRKRGCSMPDHILHKWLSRNPGMNIKDGNYPLDTSTSCA